MKLLALILSVTFLSFGTQAGDAAKGKKLYKKVNCKMCHGKKAMGKAKMVKGKLKIAATRGPRIAGLEEDYIVAQLTAIQGKDKATRRKTKYTGSMKAKIKKLSTEDMQNLAAFISKKVNAKAGAVKGMFQ